MAELDGHVGWCNLLVRAVRLIDDSWSYVAQELRSVDNIDGSSMKMILTHDSVQSSAAVISSPSDSRRIDEFVSVQKLLQQFPSVLPASLPQFLASLSALPAVHGEFPCC